jgi:hypothetical protein
LHDVVEGTPIQLHDLLTDADGGTEVVGVHERLPRAMSVADNEAGWRMALARLAALVEADQN